MSQSLTIDKKLIFNRLAQRIIRLRNNSGGSVAAGSVVIYDTTTTDAFTTTITQNDPLIAGVCLGTIANQGMGEILQEGFTNLLKVDGTTDIAVGDFLTTFTTAGIAAKRSANTSAGQFALALEAYTTNDSNGVIDAWVFAPNRVAGATSSWGDGTLLNLGTDNDIAQVLRATALLANTTLAGVVEGTPATLATAADSLIIGNVTNDGDIHLVVSKAGNSHTAFLADGSTGDTILNAATGQSVDLYVAGTQEYDFSATALDLLGNHLDNAGYLILNAVTLPASTEVYIGQDNAGDATVNALTGKTVNFAVAGTDVMRVAGAAVTILQPITVTGNSTFNNNLTVSGDLTVTGSLTYGGNWTVGATLTVDELILDTDGDAANVAATAVGLFRDNAGDGTLNIVAGKTFNISHANTDEYTFSSTVADFLNNALDNVGYIILNAATAPAGTEVSLTNDNTGDLTLNALSTKAVNIAIAGVDEVALTATASVFNEASNDRDYRFESANLAYAIYSDGGKDALVLGSNTDTSVVDQLITISRAARIATANTNYYDLALQPAGAVTVPAGTTAVVAGLMLAEPNITSTGTTTDAASFYISGEPTEGGTGNYAAMIVGSIGLIADAKDLVIGAGRDVLLRWSTADADNHALALGLGASRALHIAEAADIATDWNVAAATNPTLYIHGAATPATEYIALSTDETAAHLNSVGAYWQLEIGGTVEFSLDSTSVSLQANTLQGGSGVGGDMTLMSTSDATKGAVTIANGEQGIKIGGAPDRATTEGTNQLVLVNGTAPVGLLTNAITIYSTGGECYIMDAGGTGTLQTSHSRDGDFAFFGYSAPKDQTVAIHLEKLVRELIARDPTLRRFLTETTGNQLYQHA